jgi:MoxR-like ATPase
MESHHAERRRHIANVVIDYLDGELSYETLWDRVATKDDDHEDEELSELLDLLEHEPAASGVFGVGTSAHAAYMAQLRALAERLARGAG